MHTFKSYLGKDIIIELSGDRRRAGMLIDCGPDVLVIYEDTKYLYIPLTHIQNLEVSPKKNTDYAAPPQKKARNGETLSFAKIVQEAQGKLTELCLAERQSVYGHILHIKNDYIVFYSPVHQTLLIPIFHIKWLSPYEGGMLAVDKKISETNAASAQPQSYADSFEAQLQTFEGKVVMLDFGLKSNRLGTLEKIEDHTLEFVTTDQQRQHFHISHVKNFVSPNP
ncbi:hypothetical protein [Paenibacillus sp. MBLB4367]|uniref:hypothetical protein n=1 Tax=Paenibacillus sp. MBLB4367 TaxID=3384767 RepID=UPI0039080C7B